MEFGVTSRVPAVGGQLIGLQGLRGRYDEIFLPLYGAHQAQNAAVALAAVEAFVGGSLSDGARFATTLQANTGLRKRSLNQIAVLTTGAVRVVLFLVAGLLILTPWGLDSTDVMSSVRSAFFGFKVGDVTISLSTIAVAVGIMVLGVVVTRASIWVGPPLNLGPRRLAAAI